MALNDITPHFRQQELSNLLHEKKYLKALGIAISLDQPHTVLKVIKGTGISTRTTNSGWLTAKEYQFDR